MQNNEFKMDHGLIRKRFKTMKLLKESTRNYFHDFWIGKGFLQLKKHNLLKKNLINYTSPKYTIKEKTIYKLGENTLNTLI